MDTLKTTIRTVRIFQAISFTAVICLVATFIAEIRSIDAKPPGYLFAGLIIVGRLVLDILVMFPY